MSTEFQVKHVADAHIDDPKKALVALLELALVEYLDGNDRGLLDGAEEQ